MPNFERMSQWFKDVSRRAERVPPFGERTAQRQMLTPTEIFGVEDNVLVHGIPDGTRPMDVFLIYNGTAGKITVSSYANIENMYDAGGVYTTWINVTSDGEANVGTLVSKTQWTIRTVEETNKRVNIRFTQAFSGTGGQWTTTNTPIALGKDYHIALVYDADAVGNIPTLLINGIAVASADFNRDTTPVGTRSSDVGDDLIIGNRAAQDRTFHGRIGDVRVWNTGHNTAALIQADMYRTLTGNETGLTGYWKIDEATATTIANSVSGGNNGTLLTATWGSILAVGEGLARASEVFVLLA